jgi:hypothetical protein
MPRRHLLRAAVVCGLLAFGCLLGAVNASCEERASTSLRVALTTYAGLSALDAAQTARCVQAATCREQNPALRPMVQQPAVFVAVKSGITAAALVGTWKLRVQHPKLAAGLARGIVLGQGAVVLVNARHAGGGR